MRLALALALAVWAAGGIASAQQPAVHEEPAEAPIVAPIEGESAVSRTQREIIERWARVSALRTRYGAQHPDVVREQMMLVAAERDLLDAGAAVDRARIGQWIRAQIADVDRRLAELSVSCQSGHPNVTSAQARRAALVEAQAALATRATFLPRPD